MFKLIFVVIIAAFILNNEGCQESLYSLPVHAIKHEVDGVLSDAVSAYDKAASEYAAAKTHPQKTHGEQVCPLPDRKQRLHCLDAEYQKIVNEIRLTLKEEIW